MEYNILNEDFQGIKNVLTHLLDKIRKQHANATKPKYCDIDISNHTDIDSMIIKLTELKELHPNGWVDYDDDYGIVCLRYEIEVPCTDKEKERKVKHSFEMRYFTPCYDYFTALGYKRISCCSSEFRQFNNKTIYNLVIDNDDENIMRYLSLFFKKE